MEDTQFVAVANRNRTLLIIRLLALASWCVIAGAVFIGTEPHDEWLSVLIAFLAVVIFTASSLATLKAGYDLYSWFSSYEFARNVAKSVSLEAMLSLHSEVVGSNYVSTKKKT